MSDHHVERVGSSTADFGIREVVTIGVDARPTSIELLLVPADHTLPREWRLVGDTPTAGAVAAVERWRAAFTPVVLCVEPTREASLHGPDAHVGGLFTVDGPPAAPSTAAEALPLNIAEVCGQSYLWVTTGRGTLLHLTSVAEPGRPGRPAADTGARGLAALDAYDLPALVASTWSARTLCGLRWQQMAAHEAELDAWTAGMARGPVWSFLCPVCGAVATNDVANPYHPG